MSSFKEIWKKAHNPIGEIKKQHDRGGNMMNAFIDPGGEILEQPKVTKKEHAAKKKKERDKAYANFHQARTGMKSGGKVKKCGVGGYYRKK